MILRSSLGRCRWVGSCERKSQYCDSSLPMRRGAGANENHNRNAGCDELWFSYSSSFACPLPCWWRAAAGRCERESQCCDFHSQLFVRLLSAVSMHRRCERKSQCCDFRSQLFVRVPTAIASRNWCNIGCLKFQNRQIDVSIASRSLLWKGIAGCDCEFTIAAIKSQFAIFCSSLIPSTIFKY